MITKEKKTLHCCNNDFKMENLLKILQQNFRQENESLEK